MPGLTLKSELILFKTRLQHLVSDIEWYYDLVTYKQIIYKAQTLMRSHIDYIEDLLKDTEDLENLTQIQKQRAKTLLKPFQGLIKIEQMINEVRKNSAENPTSNLVSEPGTQS